MATDTLSDGLAAYAVGDKIRALRLKKKMGLVQLGQHTGMSPAMLSRIERGRLFPTLPTLLRIALVFGVGLETFFAKDRERRRVAIVRRVERQRFADDPTGKNVSYHFESLDFAALDRKLNAYYAEFEPAPSGRARAHVHPGAEFIHVLHGRLGLFLDKEEQTLDAGDSIYFDSSQPHAYRRIGAAPATALVVTVF